MVEIRRQGVAMPDLSGEIPYLESFLRKLSHRDAEDLVQETLVRALRYGSTYESNRSLRSWLLKIAFRVYLDHRDRSRKMPSTLGDSDVEVPSRRSDACVDSRDLLRDLTRRLRPVEQEVLLRFHRNRESLEEISSGLGMALGTVKSHLHRAREKLARVPGGGLS